MQTRSSRNKKPTSDKRRHNKNRIVIRRMRKSKRAPGRLRRRRRPAAIPPVIPVPETPSPAVAPPPEPAFNEAEVYEKGYKQGYRDGHYAGGDGVVDQLLPDAHILPETSVSHIISAGIESMRADLYPIMVTAEVVELIVQALDNREPFSLIRLGDGELLIMAQEAVMSPERVLEEGPFLSYAGVNVPDLSARDQLVEALRGATIVGIPLLRVPNFQHLAFSVFRAYGLDYRQLKLTHSTINYAIYLEHCLSRIVAGRRVLTVGNKADGLAEVLRSNGVHVVGAVCPVNGITDIPRVMEAIGTYDFDLALVAAGIPAVVIVHRIASVFGKVAMDFGHLADSLVSGETPFA